MVFLFDSNRQDFATNEDIGRLPNTKYGIPITDYNALVTHNTAILGILGIGKSRLTFELIQKVINNTGVKVICIDVTNEYSKTQGLPAYIDINAVLADDETAFNDINSKFETITNGVDGKPNIELISRLNELSKKGFEIHIYTARGHISAKNRDDAEKKYRQIIIDWLQRYNVIYAKLSFQKPFAVYYIDDKAIRPDELHLLDNLN